MNTNLSRRGVLLGGLAGLASLTLAPRLMAAPRASLTPLAGDLWLLGGLGANVLALGGSEGLTLVDSGAAGSAAALTQALKSLPGGGRVTTLVNTHWHGEQTGANAALGQAGAQILAQEKTRQRLSVPLYRPTADRYEPALPAAGRPAQGFYTHLSLAGGALELGYLLEAHTDGDCYVQFKHANIIAVGDVASPVRDPIVDWYGGGWLGGRVDALALLLTLGDADTRYVPAQGGVVTRTEIKAEHDVLETLHGRMTELLRKGHTAADMLADGVLADLPRVFADPRRLLHDAYQGLWAHHNTLSADIV